MAREIVYLVRTFKAGKGTGLVDNTASRGQSSDAARVIAESLARTKAGVAALTSSGDADLGEYDEVPTIIFRAGRLPPPFDGAWRRSNDKGTQR